MTRIKYLRALKYWFPIILGVGIAMYTYLESIKKIELVYISSPDHSIIFDKTISSPNIKLVENDSVEIINNVFVGSVTLWNNGELEVKKTDVRKPISITLDGDAQILDYAIVRETKPGISKFQVRKEDNTILLDWEFFDPKFGVEIQIIYSGDTKKQLVVDGYVLGSNIENVEQQDTKYLHVIVVWVIMLISLFSFPIMFFSFLVEKKMTKSMTFFKAFKNSIDHFKKMPLSVLLFYILLPLIFILYLIGTSIFNYYSGYEPPF